MIKTFQTFSHTHTKLKGQLESSPHFYDAWRVKHALHTSCTFRECRLYRYADTNWCPFKNKRSVLCASVALWAKGRCLKTKHTAADQIQSARVEFVTNCPSINTVPVIPAHTCASPRCSATSRLAEARLLLVVTYVKWRPSRCAVPPSARF